VYHQRVRMRQSFEWCKCAKIRIVFILVSGPEDETQDLKLGRENSRYSPDTLSTTAKAASRHPTEVYFECDKAAAWPQRSGLTLLHVPELYHRVQELLEPSTP